MSSSLDVVTSTSDWRALASATTRRWRIDAPWKASVDARKRKNNFQDDSSRLFSEKEKFHLREFLRISRGWDLQSPADWLEITGGQEIWAAAAETPDGFSRGSSGR